MEIERNPLLERSVFRRLLSATMLIAVVLACLAGVTWYIRSFCLPPRIYIPSPVSVAAAPPAPSVEVGPPSAPPQAIGETPPDLGPRRLRLTTPHESDPSAST